MAGGNSGSSGPQLRPYLLTALNRSMTSSLSRALRTCKCQKYLHAVDLIPTPAGHAYEADAQCQRLLQATGAAECCLMMSSEFHPHQPLLAVPVSSHISHVLCLQPQQQAQASSPRQHPSGACPGL